MSIEIDGRNAGKIIGPRGATIKQLQEDYNVQISISKNDDMVSWFFKCPTFEFLELIKNLLFNSERKAKRGYSR